MNETPLGPKIGQTSYSFTLLANYLPVESMMSTCLLASRMVPLSTPSQPTPSLATRHTHSSQNERDAMTLSLVGNGHLSAVPSWEEFGGYVCVGGSCEACEGVRRWYKAPTVPLLGAGGIPSNPEQE